MVAFLHTASSYLYTLNTFEVNSLSKLIDSGTGKPDFYFNIYFYCYDRNALTMNYEWFKLGEYTRKNIENNYNVQTDYIYTSNVISGSALWVKIKIELLDNDIWPNPDDRCDINPEYDHKSLSIYYDLRTSLWNGKAAFKHDGDENSVDLIEYDEIKDEDILEGSIINNPSDTMIFETHDDAGYSSGCFDGDNAYNCDISFDITINDHDRTD